MGHPELGTSRERGFFGDRPSRILDLTMTALRESFWELGDKYMLGCQLSISLSKVLGQSTCALHGAHCSPGKGSEQVRHEMCCYKLKSDSFSREELMLAGTIRRNYIGMDRRELCILLHGCPNFPVCGFPGPPPCSHPPPACKERAVHHRGP